MRADIIPSSSADDLPEGCPRVLILRPASAAGRADTERRRCLPCGDNAHWSASSAGALSASLRKRGLPAIGEPGIRVAGMGLWSTRFEFPRDVPWTELPLVGGPRYRIDAARMALAEVGPDGQPILGEDDRIPWGGAVLEAAVRHARLIVLDCPPPAEFAGISVAAGRLFAAVGRPAEAPVEWFSGAELRDARPMLAEAAVRDRPTERFEWAYQLNMRALAPRLAACVVAAAPSTALSWIGDAAAVRAMPGVLSDPWTLQVLHALRRANPEPSAIVSETLLTTTAVPGYREVGSEAAIIWEGSGARPAAVFPLAPPAPQRDISAPPAWAMHRLAFAGLATLDLDGSGRITERGRALLDLLPSEFGDPDLMLRWRTADGGICSDANVPAADRWVARAFRALKRRASALGADAATA